MNSALISAMAPPDLVGVTSLMELSSGIPEVVVGLLDGLIAMEDPDLARENYRETPCVVGGGCSQVSSAACLLGTFVTGILCAKRSTIRRQCYI
jgi:hypothetical protein